jgi:hypothetical protein
MWEKIESNLDDVLDYFYERYGTREQAMHQLISIGLHEGWHPFEVIIAYRRLIPGLGDFLRN